VTAYTISTILWTFGGIIVGFVIGFVVRGIVVRRAPAALVTEDGAEAPLPPPSSPAPRATPARLARMDVLRAVLGVALLVLVGYTVWQQTSEATCQHAANQTFQAALALRAEAARQSNDAQRTFLTSLARPDATPADKAAAMARYLDALNAQDAAQAANPLVVRDCGG
jgi:hypothetical protein